MIRTQISKGVPSALADDKHAPEASQQQDSPANISNESTARGPETPLPPPTTLP